MLSTLSEPRARLFPALSPQHERENPAQRQSRRQSQCTHANPRTCSPPPRAAHSQAEPQGCTDARRTFQQPQGKPEGRGAVAVSQIHRHGLSRCPPPANYTLQRPPQPTTDSRRRPTISAATVRAAGASAHQPTVRSVRLLCAVRRRAKPERAAPRRTHTEARAAPFMSRADHHEPTRSARVLPLQILILTSRCPGRFGSKKMNDVWTCRAANAHGHRATRCVVT